MKRILALTLLILLASKLPAAAPATGGIAVSVDTDKTAVWVGEVLRYTVRVVHPPEIEFVTDNITADQLRLAPFSVRAVELQRTRAGEDRRLFEVTLKLSTLETGKPELTIPPLHLYYFRRTPGVSRQDSAVEVLRAPAMTVGVRSTLTAQSLRPRDAKPLSVASWQAWTALTLGVFGLGALSGRAGYRVWRQWRHPEPSAAARREQRLRLAQALLNDVQRAGAKDPAVLCAAVSRALRAYIKEAFNIEAAALTPVEIEAALGAAPADFRRETRRLLEQCDQLRYAKAGARDAAFGDKLLAATTALLQTPA